MTLTEEKMGRFSVEVELANDADLVQVDLGQLQPEQVRRVRVRGVVDSGAGRLVIPEMVAEYLGVPRRGKVGVRYADGHKGERDVVERVRLSYGGRSSIFTAIVEPARESALIGAIVLEDLDFLVDCLGQKLVPRDPKQIISEIE
jgi:predicted aspartyl protease